MTRGFSILFIFVLLAGSVMFADAQSSVVARAQQITGDRFTVRGRTPLGANVYAVKQPSEEMLEAMQR